jgi:hypothetical protein
LERDKGVIAAFKLLLFPNSHLAKWVEMWWPLQTDATKSAFKKLVANGQLEFVGAGAFPLFLTTLPQLPNEACRLEPDG